MTIVIHCSLPFAYTIGLWLITLDPDDVVRKQKEKEREVEQKEEKKNGISELDFGAICWYSSVFVLAGSTHHTSIASRFTVYTAGRCGVGMALVTLPVELSPSFKNTCGVWYQLEVRLARVKQLVINSIDQCSAIPYWLLWFLTLMLFCCWIFCTWPCVFCLEFFLDMLPRWSMWRWDILITSSQVSGSRW